MFLMEWFLKSLLPLIAKDVSLTLPHVGDEAILKAQHFELIYAQSRYLFTVLPDSSKHSTSSAPTPRASNATDGLIESMHQQLLLATQTRIPIHASYPGNTPPPQIKTSTNCDQINAGLYPPGYYNVNTPPPKILSHPPVPPYNVSLGMGTPST